MSILQRITLKPKVEWKFIPHYCRSEYVKCRAWVQTQKLNFASQWLEFTTDERWPKDTLARLGHLMLTVYQVEHFERPLQPRREHFPNISPEELTKLVQQYQQVMSQHQEMVDRLPDFHSEIEELQQVIAESTPMQDLVTDPIVLEQGHESERFYCLYRGAVWSSPRDLEPSQWRFLADEVMDREEARLEVGVRLQETPVSVRERIPSAVRRAVWIRDQGKCVQCGSREHLEFDHIIPVSEGGSNTERNIELLCEVCNRAKSNLIA